MGGSETVQRHARGSGREAPAWYVGGIREGGWHLALPEVRVWPLEGMVRRCLNNGVP
jgi:hypothetical protein